MTKMQEVWVKNGLNPENYTSAHAEAMKDFAIQFVKFISDKPVREYSQYINEWKYWDNSKKIYRSAPTEYLLEQFILSTDTERKL